MLSTEDRTAVADALRTAEQDRKPIDPLIETFPGIDAVDAYEIQLINIRRRLAVDGIDVLGHKVGLSSAVMQQMMGVDEPDYGHLLTDMRIDDGGSVAADRFCYPRVEVEVGFLLGADLPGAGCTEDDVLAGTEAFVPSIELVDSRIVDWRIGLPDTVADNASAAGFVLGAQRVEPGDLDPRTIDVTLRRNGETVATGRSDAVLGNPVIAVAWLARKVASFGVRLRAGQVVLPGSCVRAIDANAGDVFDAECVGLGTVSLSFHGSGT
ncbi:MAG TPA: 2-keto-4-pentenoate hydratase [Pseudonocardiaceae bacterium]|nr:2-keto-4-pentenoate hydratase [Pseudonocardiaceae bacterium]